MEEINKNNKLFEEIKHIDENGSEFWYARELMPILQYSNWQNFEKIIDKAKISCENSGISVFDHFTDVNKMVKIGSGAYREQIDYKLTRYACYYAIKEAGGTMPENLPTPQKSLKQLEKENNRSLKTNK